MKKLSFEKFAASKIKANNIVGGGDTTKTTYDRADFGTGKTGTGTDTVYEDDDGSTCADFESDAFVDCH
jgi:hypothetical protein